MMYAVPGSISLADIRSKVCGRFDLTPDEMASGRRLRRIARPRQVGMYLGRQLTDRTFSVIGREFGGRRSWTAMHACRQIERLRASEPDIEAAIVEITAELSA